MSNQAGKDPRPYLVLTVLMDQGARPAAVTRSHGDAYERAMKAATGYEIAGLDLVEVPIAPKTFNALRTYLQSGAHTVAMYDVFPIASHLGEAERRTAGQFLAAEALWTLEEQGLLGGVPVNLKIEVPKGWSRAPQELHQKLVEAGALELSPQGIDTFRAVKSKWDSLLVEEEKSKRSQPTPTA